MFDSLSTRDARPVAPMKKVLPRPPALFVVAAAVSGHRAYYRVRGLELRSDDAVPREGSVIRFEVTGSGRTTVGVRLELRQGTHSETPATVREAAAGIRRG